MTMTGPPSDEDHPGTCDACPLMERRAFLRDTTIALVGIVATLSGMPAPARALALTLSGALRSSGDEHTYPIPAEDGATIDRGNDVIVVRYQQKAYGFQPVVPAPAHRAAVGGGGRTIPVPAPPFALPPGWRVRVRRGMDRFGVRREDDTIVVDVAKYYRQDQSLAEWDAAFVAL